MVQLPKSCHSIWIHCWPPNEHRDRSLKNKAHAAETPLLSFGLVIKSQLVFAVLGFILAGGYRGNWLDQDAFFVFYGLLLAAASFLLLLILYKAIPRRLKKLNQDLEKYGSMIGHLSYRQLAVVGILAGVSEEWLFRAFLQDFIIGFTGSSSWGAATAIIVASLGFAALHGLSKLYFVFTFVMGLILGYAYYLSGSLLMVIVWHGIYDVIALCWLKHKNWSL